MEQEIAERGIEPPMSIEDMQWKEVINLLRMDEFKRLVEIGLARNIEHRKLVKDMVPQSTAMVELMEYQEEYFLQKQSRQRNL